MRRGRAFRRVASHFCAGLHRFLQRAAVSLDGPVEMVVGDLQVMLPGDGFGVALPLAYDVRWERLFQLRMPGAPQVVPQLRPGLQAGPLDDADELGSQIGRRVPKAGEHRLFADVGPLLGQLGKPFLGLREDVFQKRPQLRVQRNQSAFLPFVVLRFGAVNGEPALLPMDVLPAEPNVLRRAAQPAVPAQRKQQPPLRIRAGLDDGLRFFLRDEVEPVAIALRRRVEMSKGVGCNQFEIDRIVEKLLGKAASFGHGRSLGQPLFDEEQSPFVRFSLRDRSQRTVGAEEFEKVPPRMSPRGQRVRLHVGTLGKVPFQERAEFRVFPVLAGLHQTRTGVLVVHGIVEPLQPTVRFVIGENAGADGVGERLHLGLDALGRTLGEFAKPNRLAGAVRGDELDGEAALSRTGE